MFFLMVDCYNHSMTRIHLHKPCMAALYPVACPAMLSGGGFQS